MNDSPVPWWWLALGGIGAIVLPVLLALFRPKKPATVAPPPLVPLDNRADIDRAKDVLDQTVKEAREEQDKTDGRVKQEQEQRVPVLVEDANDQALNDFLKDQGKKARGDR